jgi:glycosyltransferase involved in cell wall biosynthesis
MRPIVSIILCTHNRAPSLRETLAAFSSLPIPATLPTELLVVDNASTDETPAVVEASRLPQFAVRYLREPRRGKGYAYNTGIAAAQGEFLLFTDDDTRPPENWIEGMTAPLVSGTAEAVAGGVRLAAHLLRPWMTPLHRAWLAETNCLDPQNPSEMIGANMAFSHRVLDKVPAFDAALGPGALGLGDESLFSAQLLQAGYRIVAALDVVVEHHFDESRLQRSAFAQAALVRGRVEAYIAHHWRHFVLTQPHLRYGRRRLLFALWRLRRGREWPYSEGMPEAEMEHRLKLAFCQAYLTERRRPRHYEPFGLVKRT